MKPHRETRIVQFAALAVLGMAAGVEWAHGQNPQAKDNVHPSQDPRLQARLNVETERPKFEQILDALRNATGVDLSVDDNLSGHDPDYGILQPSKRGFFAWQLMDMVAQREIKDGHWEKTEIGYRLKGGREKVSGPINFYISPTVLIPHGKSTSRCPFPISLSPPQSGQWPGTYLSQEGGLRGVRTHS